MLLSALIVKLESPRDPVLYHQERVGLNGAIVHHPQVPHDAQRCRGGHRPGVERGDNDPRITPVGRFMRKTRLDEIPQLWNVLRGDMSLIGPRPERPSFVEQLTEQIPFYGQRHVVKPGVTGWAQVRYTLRRQRRRRDREDAVRPVLRQAHVADVRPADRARDHQDRGAAAGRAMTPIVNAMTVDVEDYFQASAFDRVVSRAVVGRAREPRRRATRTGCSSCSTAHGVTRDVLRARLGGRALPGAGARDRRPRARGRVARVSPSADLHADAGAVSRGRAPREGGRSRTPAGCAGARLPRAELLDRQRRACGRSTC